MLWVVGLSLVILIGVVGLALFLLKLMMSTTIRWVERSFNADVAGATEIANQGAAPATWLIDAAAKGSDEQARRWLLSNLERVIKRVSGGRAFEVDAREFALGRLEAVRVGWQRQTFAEICASGEGIRGSGRGRDVSGRGAGTIGTTRGN